MTLTSWITRHLNARPAVSRNAVDASPQASAESAPFFAHDAWDMAEQLALLLKNEVPKNSMMQKEFSRIELAMYAAILNSAVPISPADRNNYYESLKVFTRKHAGLCNALEGNVFERDVVPIVHYAIVQVANDTILRKHASIYGQNLKCLYDTVARQIDTNIGIALNECQGENALVHMQRFMLHEDLAPAAQAGRSR